MDVAAWNAILDNTYGATRGPHSPDEFEVALAATQDPATELPATTEVDGESVANGYARPIIDNDDWLDAEDAVKVSLPFAFPAPTAAWETARWAHMYDTATGTWWNAVPLLKPVDVTGAGDPPAVRLSIAAGGLFEG